MSSKLAFAGSRVDDYAECTLRAYVYEDGDVSISLTKPGRAAMDFTLTSGPNGGTQSPETAKAIRALVEAMRRDAEASPQSGGERSERHGVDCPKVPHSSQGGYMHGEDDDGPYDVDGVMYCGRCHRFMPGR